MKKILYSLIAASIVFIGCAEKKEKEETVVTEEITTQEVEVEKVFMVKSGIITYTLENNKTGFEQTIYFDDYGTKMLTEIKSGKTFGQDEFDVVLSTLRLEDKIYSFQTYSNQDVYEKYGMERTTLITKVPTEFNLKNLNFSEINDEKMAELNIKKEGVEKYLNKDCDVYTSFTNEKNKAKFLVWKNICLKADVIANGETMTMLATKFEENTEIPVGKLSLPKGYTLKDMTIIPDEKTIE